MITFSNVSKIYESTGKKVTAVDHVNMSVEEGEICVFLGPSGCGKTTLLRMVNRLVQITEGSIEIDGKDIQALDSIELRRSIGYVIQQNGLFPNMTIEENINVVPKMLGWDAGKRKNRYKELMEMMGLNPEEFRKRFPWELSGGQQQRIGVARALAADPPVMLMDEPFGALDPIIRDHLQNEFLRIQKDVKKTILFVSHDIDEAIRLGDKIAIFNQGQLMQVGTPDQILSDPKNEFVRDFIGSDREIKRLTLLTVKDLLNKGKKGNRKSNLTAEINEFYVTLDTDLRNALAVLLASPTGEAVIVDQRNQPHGILTFTDYELLTGVHPSKLKSIVH
ncbi:ABC transporter ATP-binding protein [Peribacillus cavernae]|uniref:Quaternary amine transport ATP-binding protein n=1 Tax=Peribacillus cavernae TaxID=1674310 RepID=A0A3S0VLF7_9BACI|nr:ABC transporter ATP-binding protein [Peribacillus cavernae]MDQ0217679.1 osmoprotectant transport system ATP-binding protein [Peribacillus cavernae]RUQ28152.1 ABC transporter ATP-binding protein [Peribacillus cavernae]